MERQQEIEASCRAPSAVFNKVQVPMGGLVAFLVATFTGGLVLGLVLWRGAAPMAVAEAREPTTTAAKPTADLAWTPVGALAAVSTATTTTAPILAPKAGKSNVESAIGAPAPSGAEQRNPIRHRAIARPRFVVHTPAPKASASPTPVVATSKAEAAKPAAARDWVDPFAD